ncbi:protein kinase [Trypanosoma cruzi]|nr:protein kinase [Trypanosoma cruzi]
MHCFMDKGPFSFQTPATSKLPEGNGRESVSLLCRPRLAVRLALSAFSAILPPTMVVWVNNTLLRGAANKGSSKSHAIAWEPRQIYFVALAEYRHPLPTCGMQTAPKTACHAVVFLRFRTLRRGAAVSFGRRTPKSANY